MSTRLIGSIAVLLLSASTLASAGSYSISPSIDPGGQQVGDTLMFTVSVDFVRPPALHSWSQLAIGAIRVTNTANADAYNFGGCSDMSGVAAISPPNCAAADAMTWLYSTPDTRAFSGALMSFKVVFDAPGTYELSVDDILEEFYDEYYGGYVTNHPTPPATPESPLLIEVSEPVPVEESTWGRLKVLFRGP